MINAHEAKRKTLINCECKDIMNEIEQSIKKSIKVGFYDTTIPLGETLNKELIDTLCEELTNLGYKVDYEPAMPLPPNCPSDMWDFHSYLKIDWSLEKGE